MFPNPSKKKNKRYRVVTPSINPLDSPSLVNPNGTFLLPASPLPFISPLSINQQESTTNPTTAAIGGTGQFGAMNPIQNNGPFTVNNQISVNQPVTSLTSVPSMTPTSTGASVPKPTGNNYRSTLTILDNAIKREKAALSDFQNFFNDFDQTGAPNPALLPGQLDTRTINRLGLTPTELQELGFQRHPTLPLWINTNKTTETQQTGTQPSAEFMNTPYMQYYTANKIELENQLRWDPIKKKYRKIGQIQADYGYLPDTNPPKNKKRRNAQQNTNTPKNNNTPASVTGNVTNNFNTATG